VNAKSWPYLDDSERPFLRPSITGFLDVLGFSQLSTVSSSLVESQQLLNQVAAAMTDSRAFVRESFRDHPIAAREPWAIKFFSDNLVIGFPTDSEGITPEEAAVFVIRCAQGYQLRMALNGFFVRGALTIGPICLTDEIIFGSALVECYRLESKVSIVPRVLLTAPVRDLLAQSAKNDGPQVGDPICQDIDGWWFVNYLEAAKSPQGVDWKLIERHKVSVLASLSKLTQHDVLPKFGWACRYHNVFCHWHREDAGYSASYRIDRTDEESTIRRLSEMAPQPMDS
jgi:hypothetical protein